MVSTWQEIDAPWTIEDIGAPLLDSLARGLYKAEEVLREYVQNAIDSYVDFLPKTGREPLNTVQIRIDPENSTVQILDRGVGMNKDDILQAKSIAVSHKLGRVNEFVGFRGIGIWSGLAACEQIVLITTKINDPHSYKLVIDCKSIVEHIYEPINVAELMKGRFHIFETVAKADEHYTYVKLVNIGGNYTDLLDIGEMTRYASQKLPVHFDPTWPFTSQVREYLSTVPWTTEYALTINGLPVYRYFPNEIRKPEKHIIYDDNNEQVAVAWIAGTTVRGQIEVDKDKGEVNKFAIRVKNFGVGDRNLYDADPTELTDRNLLDWYLGEVYITDTDIRPDTNRRRFQESARSEVVKGAIRRFYSQVAAWARGWSAVSLAITASEDVDVEAKLIEQLLEDGTQPEHLAENMQRLLSFRQKLDEAKAKANAQDSGKDSLTTRTIREHLRRREVRVAIDKAYARIDSVKSKVEEVAPSVVTQAETMAAPKKPRRTSKAKTTNLTGKPITPTTALGTEAVAGTSTTPSQLSSFQHGQKQVRLDIAISACMAAVAAVVGQETEYYSQIEKRLEDELRRRGIDA